jgi:RHH-type rel operon transcriptional repressor/antitoxin RelB
MAGSAVVTLRLDAKLKKQLDRLSRAMSRSRSFIAAEAIRDYVAINVWQIEQIRMALEEADRGEFASAEEVHRVVRKWTRRAR